MENETSLVKPKARIPTAGELLNYQQDIKPKLFQLSIMVRDGAPESEILSFLGISKDTFYFYKRCFPELKNAITQGKLALKDYAEQSLRQLVTGGVYEDIEVTEFQTKNKNNGEFEVVSKKVKKVSKNIPPNMKAVEMVLYCQDPENWKKQTSDSVNQTNNTVIANFNPADAELMLSKIKSFAEPTIKAANKIETSSEDAEEVNDEQ